MTGFISIAQGFYFLLTGLWPIVSIGSFQAVTGPKTDLWLVRTVGGLVAVIGAVLIFAGARGQVTAEIFLLAAGSCLVLAAVDVIYAAKNVISKIYLLDALAEITLFILWIRAYFTSA